MNRLKSILKTIFQEVAGDRLSERDAARLCEIVRDGHSPESGHPLLHMEASADADYSFASVLSIDESFLRDHVLMGTPVLPAVCHLEMAIAAIGRTQSRSANSVALKDVVLVHPLTMRESSQMVYVGVASTAAIAAEFEIFGRGGDGKDVVYSQGKASLAESANPVRIDLKQLRDACQLDAPSTAQMGTIPGPFCLGCCKRGDGRCRRYLHNTVYLHSIHANLQPTQVLQPAPPRAHTALPNSGRALRDLA